MVGLKLGLLLKTWVGLKDGENVVSDDGSYDGCREGEVERILDGVFEKWFVGFSDSSSDGFSDVCTKGLLDGKLVFLSDGF